MGKTVIPELPDRAKARLFLLGLFLLVLYVVVPRLHGASPSLASLRHAHLGLALLAVLFLLATNVFSAAMYMMLAMKRLPFGRTLGIQFANAFANRLLPAGLGGLALNVRYLQKSGHTLPQAVAVAGANNALGFVGHILLLVLVGFLSGLGGLRQVDVPHVPSWGWIVLGVTLLVMLNLFISRRFRQHAREAIHQALAQLELYRRRPGRLVSALMFSMALTICYVSVLFCSVWATAQQVPSAPDIFIVFTLGIAAQTATPTPGGLGGAEAGLFAALVAYGYESATALAAVLLYRLISYWLPLVPGVLAFACLRKRYL
ncbi:MAG TPA: lysylphosphatidylglycerol synthase transmembrane domain-containing protein [Candidatus Saccharimonadales bacterium]